MSYVDDLRAAMTTRLPDNTNRSITPAILRGFLGDGLNLQGRSVPLEYFGVVHRGFSDTPVDNLSAMNTACSAASLAGFVLEASEGVIGVGGTIILLPYVVIRGAGEENTIFRQLSVATTDAGTYADVFATPTAAQGGSYATSLSDFTIHGGWGLRNFEGQTGSTNWEFDVAKLVSAGIRYDGPGFGTGGGPSHPNLRNGASPSDSHHRVERVWLINIAGDGINAGGRGEMQFRSVKTERIARHGILMNSVDNWISDCTLYTTGDSGLKITAGNQRIVNTKLWFCGARKTTEAIGAGIEVEGAGLTNITCANVTTQDTYGPGIDAAGNGMMFWGAIDHPGGGRLEQQGLGFLSPNGGPSGTGGQTRSLTRTAIRVRNLKDSEIRVSVSGGQLIAGSPPSLADFRDSGADFVDIYTRICKTETAIATTRVTAAAGLANNKRFNRVYENGKIVYGRVTTADLADATHSVNEVGGPSFVELSPSGTAQRADGGAWAVAAVGSTVTPV